MSDFDSVVCIGWQSLLDGLWRTFGPTLRALRAPLPVAIPGFSDAIVRIRDLRLDPAPPKPGRPWFRLALKVDLSANVLLVTNVAAEPLPLKPTEAGLDLPKASGILSFPAAPGSVSWPAFNVTVPLAGGSGQVTIPTNDGDLTLPDADFEGLTGTIDLTKLVAQGLPFPAVVPIPVKLGGRTGLTVALDLKLDVPARLERNAGRGLVVGIADASAALAALILEQVNLLKTQITDELVLYIERFLAEAVAQGVLAALPAPSALKIDDLAKDIAGRIAKPIEQALTDSLMDVATRTGRLVYDLGDGSIDCLALPSRARAELAFDAVGTPFLRLAFARTAIPASIAWPAFEPQGLLDVQVTVADDYLLTLAACLLEQVPAIGIKRRPSGPQPYTSIFGPRCIAFDEAVFTAGPVALKGSIVLCIVRDAANPKIKHLQLVLNFDETVSALWMDALTIGLSAALRLSVSLDPQAALNLALFDPGGQTFDISVGVGDGLEALLTFLTANPLNPISIGAVPSAVALVEKVVPALLEGYVRQALAALTLVRSPVALPPGLFEAFGQLVPARVELDDLTVLAVFDTPTAPFELLPLVQMPGRGLDAPFSPGGLKARPAPNAGSRRRGMGRQEGR